MSRASSNNRPKVGNTLLVLVGNEAARLLGWNLAVLGALGVLVGAVSHAAQARQRLRERDEDRDDYAGPGEAGW